METETERLVALKRLEAKARALKVTLDAVISSQTEDYLKFQGYPAFFQRYNEIAKKYANLTGDTEISYFDLSKLPLSGDVVWTTAKSYFDTIYTDTTILVEFLSEYRKPAKLAIGFNEILDEEVILAAGRHYEGGDYRNAVLDAILALMDRMRTLTGLDLDGDDLVNQTFSPSRPKIILSDLDTESGKNDQRGFMDIYKGLYRGVRNPKAHSLAHDLDQVKCGQYLVLISLLMRRLKEGQIVE